MYEGIQLAEHIGMVEESSDEGIFCVEQSSKFDVQVRRKNGEKAMHQQTCKSKKMGYIKFLPLYLIAKSCHDTFIINALRSRSPSDVGSPNITIFWRNKL